MARKKPTDRKIWAEKDQSGAASRFGQLIGTAFATVVIAYIKDYLRDKHPGYILLEPEQGKQVIRLKMLGGTSRQMDNVIVPVDSREPIALLESKWLKDARHHNDKGAWILQLREVRKKYATLRGAVAVLAGYWTEGVGVMFTSEAGIRMVLVATDEEVYGTLQEPLSRYLEKNGLSAFPLIAEEIRVGLPRPWDLANCLEELNATNELISIAQSWLTLPKPQAETLRVGGDFVGAAIDELLKPLPDNPKIERLEIALQIDTGNTIYCEFSDMEQAIEFIQTHFQDPKNILKKITPQKKLR
jgi:hypothetical protein